VAYERVKPTYIEVKLLYMMDLPCVEVVCVLGW